MLNKKETTARAVGAARRSGVSHDVKIFATFRIADVHREGKIYFSPDDKHPPFHRDSKGGSI